MLKFIKKSVFILTAAVCIAASLVVPAKAEAISPDTPFPIAFQQNEQSGAEIQRLSYLPGYANWCDYPWNRGSEKDNTVGKAACSLFSVINNIYYHTGIMLDPTEIAQYALDKGYRRVGFDGVVLDFFPAFAKDYGAKYGMKFVSGSSSASTVLSHVRNGGSASSNIYGHWITIADYDAENDLYLILDSATACLRCANIEWTDRENGIAWLPASVLMAQGASGNYGLGGRYSVLFSFDYQFAGDAGDADGDEKIEISDATAVLKRYAYESAGLEPPVYHPHPNRNVLCEMTADVNGDGVVNIDDASIILEIYAKKASGDGEIVKEKEAENETE